jgi:hypothetical protein
MSHSLHRRGNAESLHDDYVILIMTSPDRANDPDVKSRMQEAWDVLSSFAADLTNFGSVRGGGRHRKSIKEFKEESKFLMHAVFKDRDAMKACLNEIKNRDLGLSVTVSGNFDAVKGACLEIGLVPHTVQYSLGIFGKTELLPDEKILEVTTMCGHAMVSPNLLAHLMKKIEAGKLTHAEAALELSRQCECGIFNPARAERLLRQMVTV